MKSCVFLLLCAVVAVPAVGQTLTRSDNPLPPPVPFFRDSGPLVNPASTQVTVHTETVRVAGAAWLRLYFGAVELEAGSFLRITSQLDGEVQELDAEQLQMWSDSSAYFNGDTVTVDVVSGAGATDRLVLEKVAYVDGAETSSLCGPDDRFPTDEDWSGRVEPNGCSAAVWRENSCIVSAGHCFDAPSDAQLIEFRVPQNSTSCQKQHPPIADQFPIIDDQWVSGGVGNDWAVGVVGTNNLGQSPFERYGAVRPIALSVPPIGAPVTIVGFGTASECLLSGTQQRSDGVITNQDGNDISHNSDTTGGNSGTGVVSNGQVIAVHTHAGCPANRATRIDVAAFAAARAALCIPADGVVTFDRPVYGCGDTVTLRVEDSSLIGAEVQDVTLASSSEPVPEIFQLSEVFDAVLGGTVATASPPASAGDGVVSVSHGDTLSAEYLDADDGTGSPQSVSATATVDCQAPVISGVEVDVLDESNAIVTWTTDEPANSTVVLEGPSGSVDVSETDLVTGHSVALTGLTGCFSYSFSVRSRDLANNEATDDNGGESYAFDGGCPPPPSIPDGSNGSDPIEVFQGPANRLRVFWDNQCVGPGPTKLVYGPLSGVSQYETSGAICDVAPDASVLFWSDVPEESFWFVMIRDNGLGVESSWGRSSEGAERNGSVPSGECDVTEKDLSLICE